MTHLPLTSKSKLAILRKLVRDEIKNTPEAFITDRVLFMACANKAPQFFKFHPSSSLIRDAIASIKAGW